MAVGPPLPAGVLPFGVGPMAAANDIQYVFKGTIAAAARDFGPRASAPVSVEEIPEREIRQEDPES